MATMSPLRQRMIEDMTVRNLSPSTQQSYIYAIAKFSRHFGYAPDRLSFEQVRAYQLHLIGQKRSWSHINQVACALRFFYGVTLGQTEAFERIIGGQKPDKLPLVLSAEEIERFLDAVTGVRNRVVLATAYAAGLRASEVVRLKVSSIDSKRMLIHIENGKGGRDRYAMLSPRLLEILRTYWMRARPGYGYFQAKTPVNMSASAASRRPAAPPAAALGLPSRLLSIRSGTRLRPISWKAGSTFASFKFCSDMPSWDRPRATLRSRPICSPARPAHSMDSPSG